MAAALVLGLIAASARPLQLHHFIDNYMVLQRAPLAARIWGNATSGARVTVELKGVNHWSAVSQSIKLALRCHAVPGTTLASPVSREHPRLSRHAPSTMRAVAGNSGWGGCPSHRLAQ